MFSSNYGFAERHFKGDGRKPFVLIKISLRWFFMSVGGFRAPGKSDILKKELNFM